MWYFKDLPPDDWKDHLTWRSRKTDFVTIPNIMERDTADLIVDYCSSKELKEGLVSNAVDNEDLRRSKIMFLEDYKNPLVEELYKQLAAEIEEVNNNHFEFNLTGIEILQYTEYHGDNNGRYGWHPDDIVVPRYNNSVRKLSFSILLSDNEEYEDGDFQVLYPGIEQLSVPLNKGDAIFFPSNMIHQVKPVTSGVRKSLVGWVQGPNWK